MNNHVFYKAIEEVKIHYFFKAHNLKPNKSYKGLDEKSLTEYEKIIEENRTKIYDRDFYGITKNECLMSLAGPIQADLGCIAKLKRKMLLPEALIKSKGIDREQAVKLADKMRIRVWQGENPEKVLLGEGLEPDNVFDLLD